MKNKWVRKNYPKSFGALKGSALIEYVLLVASFWE